METQRRTWFAFLLPSVFIAFAAATAGMFLFKEWRPQVASEHGIGVDRMITYLLITTGTLFVLGHSLLAVFVWKFSGRGDNQWKPISPKTEWLWTILPVVTMTAISEIGVLAIGMPVWSQVFHNDPEALQVEITGRQFEWISRYPGKDGVFGRTDVKCVDDVENPLGLDPSDPAAHDDIVVRGLLVVPAGRAVQVRVRSMDVVHSFSIPVFRTKQDAVPGFPQRTRFVPTTEGKFDIACAQICGLGHYKMRAFVLVKSQAEFDKWMSRQSGIFD